MSIFARRVFVVVALLATLYGLLHVHAIFDSSHSAAGQTCVLCVTTHTSALTAAARLAPPTAHDLVLIAPRAGHTGRNDRRSIASRAPPQA